MSKISREDLHFISLHLESLFPRLQGRSILISGGTGFFGKWILQTIGYLNKEKNLKIKLFVLSRSPKNFQLNFPEMNTGQTFLEGDIRTFKLDKTKIDYAIHAGVNSESSYHQNNAKESMDTFLIGTKNFVDMATKAGASHFLNISSGAVYAQIKKGETSYALGKIEAEKIVNTYSDKMNVTHARCFSFAGAYLPLDGSFAFGNFIKNKIKDEKILIKGDGEILRSYLYMADLVIWLFHVMLRGKNTEPFNIGSDEVISISNLARSVDAIWEDREFVMQEQGDSNNQYIPDIKKIKDDLGMKIHFDFSEIVKKVVGCYK